MKCFQRLQNLAFPLLDQERQLRNKQFSSAKFLNIEVVGYLKEGKWRFFIHLKEELSMMLSRICQQEDSRL